ncbi:MAG TPA: prephenate dehydrogenase/arogenate dehydrogenase family protein [Terriglobales bacterium]|nr:prephenate dehydrogenase/arogenate dehydrogenase family protein [Terriglobales bacterium]
MRVSIVGLGLIGGSIARALHERNGPGRWHVTAWSRSAAPIRKALADGAIDVAAGTLEEAVRDAEIVILAAPPLTCLDLVDQLSGPMRGAVSEDCTVTDVASAKARIVARADAAGLPFIGGHPMAGREASGYGAAIPDLFVDRPWVTVIGRYARLCDGERIGELVEACGAIQVPMDAVAHDNAVAAISHMPLIVSAAVAEAIAGGPSEYEHEDWRAAEALAATGWAGITRLARGDPTMGAGIAATNSAAIAVRLRDVRAAIDEWIAELEREGGPDSEALLARFTSARRRLVDSQRE